MQNEDVSHLASAERCTRVLAPGGLRSVLGCSGLLKNHTLGSLGPVVEK